MRFPLSLLLGACAVLSAQTCATSSGDAGAATQPAAGRADSVSVVPDWAADAIWYQIFPERFRNGSTANDPTRETLETPIVPDSTWRLSPWTGDWYARDAWEQAMGDDFYENGVFHRRYGGDLIGVLEKLDYLQELGVNALYFNPVFYARSLHKYDGSSFHHVDPHFGPDPAGDLRLMATETADPATWKWTAADRTFLRLIQEAHRRGMRIVIDGVFNHTGRDFFAFDDIRRNGPQSPYKDWYIVEQYDDPATPQSEFKYKGWWGVESLPEFANTADSLDLHPGPKDYVFAATRRWMDPDGNGDPSDGIDGWRLDVAEEVPIKFWHDWNALVRSLNPEAYTTTEIWGNAAHYLREGEFSGTMSYWAFAYPVKGYLIDRAMPVTAFRDTLQARLNAYPEPQRYALQNLVGSHDTDRLASMIVNAGRAPYRDQRYNFDEHWVVSPRQDPNYRVRAPNARERDLQRLVVLFKNTYVGAPMIYYGDEVGMWGADDPDDRKPMVWADLGPYQAEASAPRGIQRSPDAVRVDTALLGYYRRAFALRKDEPALRRGEYAALLADSSSGVFAFERTYEGKRLVVVLNPSDAAHSVRIPVPGGPGRRAYAVRFTSTAGAPVRVQQDAQALLVEIAPRTGLVLAPGDR
jgi:cyclomaltodextrinase / maltogenic alpha-amylase / neopullulanase